MVWKFVGAAMAVAGLLVTPAAAQEPKPVVFVCEHGAVKSVIAAQWFNRLAAERGLAVRAVSRGTEPDAAIPAGVAANLTRDGFTVAGQAPVGLQPQDVTGATHVVAIGAQSTLFDGAAAPVDRWDDIPPGSTSYDAARDEMRRRIEALLDKLASQKPPK